MICTNEQTQYGQAYYCVILSLGPMITTISTEQTTTSQQTSNLPTSSTSTNSSSSMEPNTAYTTAVDNVTTFTVSNATDDSADGIISQTIIIVIAIVLTFVLAVSASSIIAIIVCARKIKSTVGRQAVPCAMQTMQPVEREEGMVGRVKQADVYFLVNELHTVAAKWKSIGGGLGFLPGELENIAMTEVWRPAECLAKLLMEWAEWPNSRHKDYPTVDKLCEVLRSLSVGAGATADELESKQNQLPSMVR